MSREKSNTSPSISRAARALRTRFTVGIGFGLALAACGGEGGDSDDGSGGSSGTPGTGGAASSGGMNGSGGGILPTGGAPASGGGPASGGAPASGGEGPTGGGPNNMDGTGGTDNGTGGDAATGGDTGTGGGGSDDCEIGTTQGNEVLFIGESFVAASSIPEETTNLARAAGSLAQNDSYLDASISGTWIGNGAGNSIPNQYRDNADGIRFVLMNGGGNDCWIGGGEQDRNNALDAAAELFDDMAENGVEKIVYFFYPDPIGGQYASLTACLDLLRPEMQALCDAQISPECHWVDLRETWDGHPEYTSDGIHVDTPGNVPTATAIFNAMQENCVAP